MQSEHHIVLHVKTADSYEAYADFSLGTASEEAKRLFRCLAGSTDSTGDEVIMMERQPAISLCAGRKGGLTKAMTWNAMLFEKDRDLAKTKKPPSLIGGFSEKIGCTFS